MKLETIACLNSLSFFLLVFMIVIAGLFKLDFRPFVAWYCMFVLFFHTIYMEKSIEKGELL